MSELANNIMKLLEMEEIVLCPSTQEEPQEKPTSNVPAVIKIHTQESDIELARNNIRDMIEDTRTSLDELSKMAKDSESPRAYEVLAQFIQTFADLNKDLVDSYPAEKEKLPAPTHTTNNIDKAVFVGSTTDLAEIVKKQIQNNANNIPKQS